MPLVILGNRAVLEPYKPNPDVDIIETRERGDLGQQATEVRTPDGLAPLDVLREITTIWALHSSAPPAWVECDDENTAQFVAAQYGCRVGRPRGWKPNPTSEVSS